MTFFGGAGVASNGAARFAPATASASLLATEANI